MDKIIEQIITCDQKTKLFTTRLIMLNDSIAFVSLGMAIHKFLFEIWRDEFIRTSISQEQIKKRCEFHTLVNMKTHELEVNCPISGKLIYIFRKSWVSVKDRVVDDSIEIAFAHVYSWKCKEVPIYLGVYPLVDGIVQENPGTKFTYNVDLDGLGGETVEVPEHQIPPIPFNYEKVNLTERKIK